MNEIATAADRFGILDHVPMGICVIRKDYITLFWNSCLEDWTGITKPEIVGSSLAGRLKHFNEEKYRSRLETIFEGGPPAIFSSQLHKDLFPSRLPDGETRIQHTIVTPVPAFDNKGYYAMFASSDVSELTHRIHDYRTMRDKALEEIEQRKRAEAEREKLITELQEALKKVRMLSGMLPICAACKKIRDDQGYWQQVEQYMSQYAPVNFTHSLCPDCAARLYPEYFETDSDEKQNK